MVVILTFIVLGGGAYAAIKLPKNSVGTKQLKKNAVKGVKVADGSLSAVDIAGAVNSAKSATHADTAAFADRAASADRATDAALLDGLDSSAFQQVPKVKTERPEATKGGITDFTPDVSGLSVLVLDYDVPTVLGDLGKPSFTGGVEGQRLTIVSVHEAAIFTPWPDLKLATPPGSWGGEKGDTLTLVFANGVWYETGRSDNH
jgi:hypothetical protein